MSENELHLATGTMQFVPGGVFRMGSDEDWGGDPERPEHEVSVSDFYMDRFPVTNRQFEEFCRATGYRTTAERLGRGDTVVDGRFVWVDGACWRTPKGPDSSIETLEDHPVILATTEDAVQYCRWRSRVEGRFFRLPTEAEWERAARGTDQRRFPWGKEPVDEGGVCRARYCVDSPQSTAPVGTHPAGVSVFGLHDMAGNTWEWCLDAFDAKYFKRAPTRDVGGPLSLTLQSTFRGGSWVFPADELRATARHTNNLMRPSAGIGFRTVFPFRKTVPIALRLAARFAARRLSYWRYVIRGTPFRRRQHPAK